MTVLQRAAATVIATAFFATSALAQGSGWPTVSDFFNYGDPVEQAELEELLTQNLSIIGVTLGGAVMGYIGACGDTPPQFIEFDWPISSLLKGACRFEGNLVCGRSEETTSEECVEVRRIGSLPLLFAQFTSPEGPSKPPEEMMDAPATVLGIVEGDIANIASASGTIELGPINLTLPAQPEFDLSHAQGFPISVTFSSAFGIDGQSDISIEMVGWPEPLSLGHVSDPAIGPDDPSVIAEVKAWGDDYSNRPLGANYLGMNYKRDHFEVSPAQSENGACVRIVEQISIEESEESVNISPKSTLYLRQFCIAPGAGIKALISYSVSDQMIEEAPVTFRLNAASLLDTIAFSTP